MSKRPDVTITCPLPGEHFDAISMAHGGGGKMSQDLLQEVFLPAFKGDALNALEDQASICFGNSRMAVTTDSFVVDPLFFPGGDIGSLAIYGSVNDLVVGGAKPLYIAAAFIIEEGLPIKTLQNVSASMSRACDAAGVELVTGDTKVVEKGKGDKLFITTTAIGIIPEGIDLSIRNAQDGDLVVVSGNIGDHGVAIMSMREGLEFASEIESDCAPLHELSQMILEVCPGVRCMRDATRGGVATVLNEMAQASSVGVTLDYLSMPVSPSVRGACEILGLDPLYIANEGKLIAVVPFECGQTVIEALHRHPLGQQAAIIGQVHKSHAGRVSIKTVSGVSRVLPMLAGENLPRIC